MTLPPARNAWAVFIFFFAIFSLTNSGVDISEASYNYQLALQIIQRQCARI